MPLFYLRTSSTNWSPPSSTRKRNGQVTLFARQLREGHAFNATAADLAKSTDSELHVVHVGEVLPTILAQTEGARPSRTRGAGTAREASEKSRGGRGHGRGVPPEDGAGGRRDSRPRPQHRRRFDSAGQQGARQDEEGAHGQRIGLRSETRPLPGYHSPGISWYSIRGCLQLRRSTARIVGGPFRALGVSSRSRRRLIREDEGGGQGYASASGGTAACPREPGGWLGE